MRVDTRQYDLHITPSNKKYYVTFFDNEGRIWTVQPPFYEYRRAKVFLDSQIDRGWIDDTNWTTEVPKGSPAWKLDEIDQELDFV